MNIFEISLFYWQESLRSNKRQELFLLLVCTFLVKLSLLDFSMNFFELGSYATAFFFSIYFAENLKPKTNLIIALAVFFCGVLFLNKTFSLVISNLAFKSIAFDFIFFAFSTIIHGLFVGHRQTIMRFMKQSTDLENSSEKSQYLTKIVSLKDSLNEAPSAQIVTVVFIDIVGHSLISQTLRPKKTFKDLQKIYYELTLICEKHNGLIDRILGDGMLVIFGATFDEDETTHDSNRHAIDAVLCALEIQRRFLQINKEKAENSPVYPLRIGLNTAFSYLGNVSTEKDPDFTVIGDGVVFAKRLQDACQPFSILIGPSTYDVIQDEIDKNIVIKKQVSIKHHDDMVDAFEVTPFDDYEMQTVNQLMSAFRNYLGIVRKDKRISVPRASTMRVFVDKKLGELVNISQDGFCAKLSNYYGKDIEFTIHFESDNRDFNYTLQQENLSPLIAQVKWSCPSEDGYIHGFSFKLNQQSLHTRLFEIFMNEIRIQSYSQEMNLNKAS